ncbi:four helix bundle protein [Anaerophaga thermohalophila]|uniref:four helix bundle protein n=1 Tax=Anaerophaga thermohalophila TaxID=177400 RepID=UPI002100656B|nr:four helix bundle protein [Anaerophaga thermohalophila]
MEGWCGGNLKQHGSIGIKAKVKVKVNINKAMLMYSSFEEMPVWQKANQLSIDVFYLPINLPKAEDYGLTSQIRRSSNSVAANIAEGFGRRTKKDKSCLYVVARGSAFEAQNHLIYGLKVEYFDKNEADKLIQAYNDLIYDLNKIIRSLN